MKSLGQTPSYLAKFEAFSDQGSFEAMYRMIPRLKNKNLTIVDVMAGIGLVGKNIAQRIRERRGKYASVTFLDLSEEMLAYESYQPADRRICADVKDMPLPDGIADVVTCRCGLNNLTTEEWEPALKEIIRITASEGIILLQDHLPLTEQQKIEMDAIEQLIATIDGRTNQPALKTLSEVCDIISTNKAEVLDVETISYPFDIRKRLKAKGILTECMRKNEIVYPVSTLAARKL